MQPGSLHLGGLPRTWDARAPARELARDGAGRPVAPIRVLVLDDHLVVAEGLALTLSHEADMQVVGVATSATDAVQLAVAHEPAVALLDFYLPDGTGVETAIRIREHCPEVAILILTATTSDDVLQAAVEAGACGFLLKTQAATQVVAAVRQAAEGEMLISAATLVGLLARNRDRATGAGARREPFPTPQQTLTPREREILTLMARGASNRQIAELLVVEYATVRSHVQRVLDKLEAHSRLEAVARASAQGLLH